MPTGSPGPSGRSAIAEDAEGTGDPAAALDPLARLALAYAPPRARDGWLTLLALDARLAGVVRTAREPILAQLKLAWWRDRLAADPAGWPRGEPLLARLAGWRDPAGLVPLVDGWEALLGEPPLDKAAFARFAEGRAAALAGLARHLGSAEHGIAGMAREWSLAQLALDPAHGAAGRLPGDGPLAPIDRAMRPLAVLAGVTLRAARRGDAARLYSPGAWFAAVRLGLLGR
ncbi:hypothetical protein ACFOD9_08580 [Novosphingobium bradum]|uniref:Phytoene synthase n=1 Tax=Novosphingobium bradum TaxID=1737444 RepID=A0ABV7INU0_9SPHN